MYDVLSLCYNFSMFDSLSEKLQDIISKTRGKELTQDNMQEALREIRRALLEADVNLRVVKSFISSNKKMHQEACPRSVRRAPPGALF